MVVALRQPPNVSSTLLLRWIKPEPAVRAFFRPMQTSARGLRASAPLRRLARSRLRGRVGRRAARAGIGRRRMGGRCVAVAARAEVADAFAHRAQARDTIFGMGGSGLGDARIERVELGFAAGAGGDGGRRGGQQGGRDEGRKSLFHHAGLLFFGFGRSGAARSCAARRGVPPQALGSPGLSGHDRILAHFGRHEHGTWILFDHATVFPL
ncbi:conserved hypothetical protein [Burkholderia cenocepacia]|nr:conserved hypothetical protein [Burkholderia cenocepacia]